MRRFIAETEQNKILTSCMHKPPKPTKTKILTCCMDPKMAREILKITPCCVGWKWLSENKFRCMTFCKSCGAKSFSGEVGHRRSKYRQNKDQQQSPKPQLHNSTACIRTQMAMKMCSPHSRVQETTHQAPHPHMKMFESQHVKKKDLHYLKVAVLA